MYRLLLFLRRIYLLVIFLALEGLVLGYYARRTAQSRARLLSLSDTAVGGAVSAAERFFTLGATNRMLESRVGELENELTLWRRGLAEARLDSMTALMGGLRGEVVVARVVRNSVSRAENYFTVDRGARDGVERGMAAMTVDGCVAGYVVGVSGGNALCMSVLNTDFRASGMFLGSGHFGSVSWLGMDKRRVRLTEVPKYAEVARGDTVVTRSSINFPEGLMVGTVEEFSVDEARASYDIDVRLGADMAALRVVALVRNPEAGERLRLEEDVLGTSGADGE